MIRVFIIVILTISLYTPAWSWDFSKHSIPIEDILSGGPPKDGIPALMNPKYVKAEKADFMQEDEQILVCLEEYPSPIRYISSLRHYSLIS